MSKYIKEHALSVGFNPQLEQTFFDIINSSKYRDYIHSYFFSLNCQFLDKPNENIAFTDPKDTVRLLKECDTYNIPANLLFNEPESNERKFEFIEMIKDIVNLKAVTCLSLRSAIEIKEKYPELEIHLSIRYFDWAVDNYLVEHKGSTIKDINGLINHLIENLLCFNYENPGVIEVVNVSGAYSFNDFELFKRLKSNGLSTKIILNEPCIGNKWSNFTQFPRFKDKCCYGGKCGGCGDLKSQQEWLRITTVEMYKESLKYYSDIDIFKLSSRGKDMNTFMRLMDYYTSDNRTQKLFMNFMKHNEIVLNDASYEIFLEFIDTIMYCQRDCYHCQKCKSIYEELIKENGLS